MKIHASCANTTKGARKRNPYKIKKQKKHEKKRVMEERRGYTELELAQAKATTEHQRKMLKTNPHANVKLTKKKLRKLEKARRKALKEATEAEDVESGEEEIAAADVTMEDVE